MTNYRSRTKVFERTVVYTPRMMWTIMQPQRTLVNVLANNIMCVFVDDLLKTGFTFAVVGARRVFTFCCF